MLETIISSVHSISPSWEFLDTTLAGQAPVRLQGAIETAWKY